MTDVAMVDRVAATLTTSEAKLYREVLARLCLMVEFLSQDSLTPGDVEAALLHEPFVANRLRELAFSRGKSARDAAANGPPRYVGLVRPASPPSSKPTALVDATAPRAAERQLDLSRPRRAAAPVNEPARPTCGRECPGFDVCRWIPDPGDGLACFTTCVPSRAKEADNPRVIKPLHVV